MLKVILYRDTHEPHYQNLCLGQAWTQTTKRTGLGLGRTGVVPGATQSERGGGHHGQHLQMQTKE